MKNTKNVHDGHRERLRKKFIENKNSFLDHELLELILSYSIPRVNTNELAHRLIASFGSLSGVFSADVNSLKNIEGVGEKTAVFIKSLEVLTKRITPKDQFKGCKNISEVCEKLETLFKNRQIETLYILYLDDKDKVICGEQSEIGTATSCYINIDELTKGILAYKPSSIILAHNHFTEFPLPSNVDDETTAKIYMLLQFYKVNLYDHLIFGKKSYYSYFYTNKLDFIKNKVKNNLF